MKRFLRYGIYIIVVILALYSIVWTSSLFLITRNLTERYANQDISVKAAGIKDEYFIKFSKINLAGFPFIIGIKVFGWTEEGRGAKIEFLEPIVIGYDLLKQSMFVNYSGQVIARYKPLQNGFGSKINIEDHTVSFKVPLTFANIKVMSKAASVFELVNFVTALELSSKGVEIFDLVDNTKIYNQDYIKVVLDVEKHRYYNSLKQVMQDVPKQLNIAYSAKIDYSIQGKKLAPVSLVYGAFFPFVYNATGNMYIRTNATSLDNFFKDIEVGIKELKTATDVHDSFSSLLYKSQIKDDSNHISLQATTKLEFKAGFMDRIFDLVQGYFSDKLPGYVAGGKADNDLASFMHILPDAKEKFRELENRQYEINLDLDCVINPNSRSFSSNIHNFNIASGKTSINLSNKLHVLDNKGFKTKIQGAVLLHNFSKIVDILVANRYLVPRFANDLSNENRYVYGEVVKDFLRHVSDHPNSTSNDISLQYNLASGDEIAKAKIGNTELGKLGHIYYASLYRKVSEMLKPGENLADKIKELSPEIANHPKALKQLIVEPKANP